MFFHLSLLRMYMQEQIVKEFFVYDLMLFRLIVGYVLLWLLLLLLIKLFDE